MYSTSSGTGDARTTMDVCIAPSEESQCNGEGTGVEYSSSELNICKQDEKGVYSTVD